MDGDAKKCSWEDKDKRICFSWVRNYGGSELHYCFRAERLHGKASDSERILPGGLGFSAFNVTSWSPPAGFMPDYLLKIEVVTSCFRSIVAVMPCKRC